MSKICVVCGDAVVHEDLCTDSDAYPELCEQADMRGMDSLTENGQAFVNGHVCSDACYYDMP